MEKSSHSGFPQSCYCLLSGQGSPNFFDKPSDKGGYYIPVLVPNGLAENSDTGSNPLHMPMQKRIVSSNKSECLKIPG